jgi:hypothetical protein
MNKRLAGIVDRRGLAGKPHGLAALGDDRLRIAALLRALRLDEILGVQRNRRAAQQERRYNAD